MYPILRRTIADASRASLSEQLDVERNVNVDLCGTPQFAEGVRVFFEKRHPRFQ